MIYLVITNLFSSQCLISLGARMVKLVWLARVDGARMMKLVWLAQIGGARMMKLVWLAQIGGSSHN
jgi:hypothetical protein